MAKETECQTDGVIYGMVISPKFISVEIELPHPIYWTPAELEILKGNIHNAMEITLAKYFYTHELDQKTK